MLCLYGGLNAGAATTVVAPTLADAMKAVPDSIGDDDDDEAPVDTTTKTRRNLATEFNALKYVMEHRYRNYGDKFTKRWDDHLFIEVGAGFHDDVGNSVGNLSPITTAHLAVGKQFSRLHSARLGFGAGFGYYEGRNDVYKGLWAKADWIFSLTTYMDGYRPSRLMDVSTVLGVGLRHNASYGTFNVRNTKEAHAGLQLRFFTGPQGYLTLEPYAGVASTHFENKYGFFYGANLNFIYYIHNNLSTEERMRYMRNRPEAVDSVLKPPSWRTPWFAELSGGLAFFKGSKGTSTAPGHTTTISVGRWISPVIGLRLSGSLTSTTWQQRDIAMGIADDTRREELGVPVQPNAQRRYHNLNYDVRAEALINPFGFTQSNSWDSPFGMYVVVGGGLGWIIKSQDQELQTKLSMYTAGLHLTYNLTNDLQVFVEPRFTNYNYNIPYSNIQRKKKFSDNVITASVGLTAYTRGRSFRPKDEEFVSPRIPLSVGVGGGTSLIMTKDSYKGASMNYNGNVFAEYHFGKVHTARVAFEYMSLNGISAQSYHATDITGDTQGYNAVGLFKHSYRRGFLSLNYLVNVTNLCSGYQGRRLFEAELFAGPTIMFAIGATHSADASITPKAGHTIQTYFYNYTKPLMGANGGIKLRLNATRHLAVTMTPQLHVLRYSPMLTGVSMTKFHGIETLDFGVQYDF